MLRTLLLFAILCPLLAGGRVPGRYIVELESSPAISKPAARQAQRSAVRAEQQKMRGRIEQVAEIRGSVDTVANAFIVEQASDDPRALAALPGVRKVYPVRTFRMLLDRAVGVHRVNQAWNRIGIDRAGAGIKIGIIDSGIEASHAGFQDSSLAALDGYPKLGSEADRAHTNAKIVAARSYVNLLPYRDPDTTARDRVGHGTALAMIAAGVGNNGITGVAPKSYLGVYKVFGTPGYNDTTTDEAILKALDDAVADGMDIVNLSLGDDFAPRLEDDIEVQAIERAVQAGVLVVVAAGNNGPGGATVASPATAPSAIAVGASRNDRTFAASVEVPGVLTAVAIPGSASTGANPVTASVGVVDTLACGALASGSLSGRIALIQRGECTFESKLINARAAGAVAAIVYAAPAEPDPFVMGAGTATLPAEMISHSDGLAIRDAALAAEVVATMRFTTGPVAINPHQLASFSSKGPGVDTSVKPDVVAVGVDMLTATQTYDRFGDMYSETGYIVVGGTSFSTPFTTGLAALIKSARPGLSVEQYRSLIVDTAPALAGARLQQAGAGLVDAMAALDATLTASPAIVHFGAGTGDPDASRMLKLTNIGGVEEIYTVSVEGAGALPVVETNTITLAPGASGEIALKLQARGLQAGAVDGAVRITGSVSGPVLRVPYWYGVRSDAGASISIIYQTTGGRRGGLLRDAIYFKVLDAAGLPIASPRIEVETLAGGGNAESVSSHDAEIPGLLGLNVRLGNTAGANRFRVRSGDAYVDISITGR